MEAKYGLLGRRIKRKKIEIIRDKIFQENSWVEIR
jgi:hypothetical protein